ncbi:MAG TPA: aldo/keto reductase [Steroidobacteraceae bacterium]|jgi:aryl-alcohol dehydrogenase-like predicted oxidoreductase|nr:aldo/keto reductase [Steroidobacteraceae bacterium]
MPARQLPPVHALTDYLTLGRSGLRVSPVSLGAMTFGEEVVWGADVKTSEAVLESYFERGGNFIDTANGYTRGHSEKIVGDYLVRTGRRERTVLATKFFANMYAGDPNGGGAGRKSLMRACHESLRRLQTDYIDLYWLHFWDPHTPIEETLRALDDLVRAGKVRYIGFSDTPAWKVAQAQTQALLRGWTPLVAIQIEYSLMERSHEAEMLPMCEELGLHIAAWSPLKSGMLTGKYTRANVAASKPGRGDFVAGAFNERNFAILDAVIAIAEELGTSPARVAIAWLLTRPGIPIPIIGARTLEQFEQNIGALEVSLSPEQLQRLDAASSPPPDFISRVGMLAPMLMHGGMSVNGIKAPPFPMGPREGEKTY